MAKEIKDEDRLKPRIYAGPNAAFCKRGTLRQFAADNPILGKEEIAIVYDTTRYGHHALLLGDGIRDFISIWNDPSNKYWPVSMMQGKLPE